MWLACLLFHHHIGYGNIYVVCAAARDRKVQRVLRQLVFRKARARAIDDRRDLCEELQLHTIAMSVTHSAAIRG